jgi:hypothetical protein
MRYSLSPELLDQHSPGCAAGCGAAISAAAHSPNTQVEARVRRPVATPWCSFECQARGEVQTADASAKLAVVTMARIGEYHSFGRIRFGQGPHLLQGDLGFGLESNLLRNSRPGPAGAIRDPFLGHIEPISHRQAGMGGG